jgi:hypothetical protein
MNWRELHTNALQRKLGWIATLMSNTHQRTINQP